MKKRIEPPSYIKPVKTNRKRHKPKSFVYAPDYITVLTAAIALLCLIIFCWFFLQ